ncbi:MAG: methylenetetrahydrofolate reductase C-terminal domain-containing protein [Anaerolineales bacterium]|nr:methylenetetrahydrofolate reductase C-terminal domain-containing protein [Anaerolineales bacterium]
MTSRLGRWIQDRPRLLEWSYRVTAGALQIVHPAIGWIGYERLNSIFESAEKITKRPVFDCRMCGMCSLHSTGMTCPMTCPKEMRNGPCGGVRPDGRCEVNPEMDCVWVMSWRRAADMQDYGDQIMHLQPPVDYKLQGSSAWLNQLRGRDRVDPEGWLRSGPVVEEASIVR